MEGSMKKHEGYTCLKRLQYKKCLDQVMEKSLQYMNCIDEDNFKKSRAMLDDFINSPLAIESAPDHIDKEELEHFSSLLMRALDVPEVQEAVQQKVDEEKSAALVSVKLGIQVLIQQVGDDLECGRGGAAAERFLSQPFLQEDTFYLEIAARAQRALNLVDALPLRKAQEKILEVFLERGETVSDS